MEIIFTKLSDQEHALRIRRSDNSQESTRLASRSFLRHDFAHLAIELELPLRKGFWGSVAAGDNLDGKAIQGEDIMLAETMAARIQSLLRDDEPLESYQRVLKRIQPDWAPADFAARVYERARQLKGQWRSTPYGGEMHIQWPL